MFLGVRKRQIVLEILYGGWGKQPTLIVNIQDIKLSLDLTILSKVPYASLEPLTSGPIVPRVDLKMGQKVNIFAGALGLNMHEYSSTRDLFNIKV